MIADDDDDDFLQEEQHPTNLNISKSVKSAIKSSFSNCSSVATASSKSPGKSMTREQTQCPICERRLPASFDAEQVTAHVNKCLDTQSSPNDARKLKKPILSQQTLLSSPVVAAAHAVKKEGSAQKHPQLDEVIVIDTSSSSFLSEPVEQTETEVKTVKRSAAEEWMTFFRNVRTRAGLTFGYGFTNARPIADSSSSNTASASEKDKKESASTSSLSKSSSVTSEKAPAKACPFYKKMPGTRFVVDAFSYGKVPGVTGYFLTHFHSDHYMGLTSKFDHGTIYCSEVTANLVMHQIKVDSKHICILPINETTQLEDGISVHLINANHCPGSVLLYFTIPQPLPQSPLVILHTGDFRASKTMHVMHPLIRKGPAIDLLYLDTTYCKPQYTLPPQDLMIYSVGELCKHIHDSGSNSNERVLFVCGTYFIGKERVFVEIAKRLKSNIYADRRKTAILKCQNNPYLDEHVVDDLASAQVHVVQMNKIHDIQFMQDLLVNVGKGYDRIVAFKPTGWSHTSKTSKTLDAQIPNWLRPSLVEINSSIGNALKVTAINDSGTVVLISFPYSEHSSYDELEMFVKGVRAKRIIPTVNMGTEAARTAMQRIFTQWRSSSGK